MIILNIILMILVFRYFKIQEDNCQNNLYINSRIHKFNLITNYKSIKYIIPVGRTSKEDAEKSIKEFMKSYKREIKIP